MCYFELLTLLTGGCAQPHTPAKWEEKMSPGIHSLYTHENPYNLCSFIYHHQQNINFLCYITSVSQQISPVLDTCYQACHMKAMVRKQWKHLTHCLQEFMYLSIAPKQYSTWAMQSSKSDNLWTILTLIGSLWTCRLKFTNPLKWDNAVVVKVMSVLTSKLPYCVS